MARKKPDNGDQAKPENNIMLQALALPFPEIDPVLIEVGPLAIRWYSLAYIAGIVLGWLYVRRLNHALVPPVLSRLAMDDIVMWIILGVVLGGRLGYVLFYQPEYYWQNPAEILQVWQGGMSFHGGFLGVLVMMWWFAKRRKTPFFRIMDLLACAAPIGLLFGRLANFINGELYGRASDVPWAVVFPAGGGVPRHPSQLYEAALEGLVLFILLSWLAWRTDALQKPRLLSGVFLIGYGVSRLLVELVREPDAHLGTLTLGLTMGQWLSVPMVLIGIWLVRLAVREAR